MQNHTEPQTDNPFWSGRINGRDYFSCSVEDRKDMIREFNADQCQAALKLPGLQTAVITALQRRLKKLEKAHG